MEILNELFKLRDEEYAQFQSRLTPSVSNNKFIGVRVPELRKLAKKYIKEKPELFMKTLPHEYYDENMLHALLISEIKEYETCIKELDLFLPYIDNWAVCDTLSPKVFKKHKDKLIFKIKEWIKSQETYTCRFGVKILMNFFLDEDFKTEYLEIPLLIHSEEYYVKMMIAWFYATALSKQWDATIPYIEENKIDKWIHNKTIQKARESFRITNEQKEYLKRYR